MKKQKRSKKIRMAAAAAAASIAMSIVPAFAEDISHGTGSLTRPPETTPDNLFTMGVQLSEALPEKVDLTDSFPKPGDQGSQNSCVGWAIGYAYKTHQEKQDHNWDNVNITSRQFSPSYIYNQIHINGDSGAYLEDAFDLLINQGVCTIEDMPYNKNNYTTQPTAEQKQRAYPHRAVSYRYIQPTDLSSMKYVLSENDGVVINIPIYPDFVNLSEGNPIYDTFSGTSRGYHTVCLIGYDDEKQAFKFINSWGTSWGLDGYGYIAYSGIESLDAWGYVMTDYQENNLPSVSNLEYSLDSQKYTWDSVPGAEKYEISVNGESHMTDTNSYIQAFTVNNPYQTKVRVVEESTDTFGDWTALNVYYGMYGDINQDGSTTKTDLYRIMDYVWEYMRFSDAQKFLADVNQDGKIDLQDTFIIRDYTNGERTSIAGSKVVVKNVVSYLYGDVNLDGVIDDVDAQMIQEYWIGLINLSDLQILLADVDGEDGVDSADALAIQQYFLGSRHSFIVGKYGVFYEN